MKSNKRKTTQWLIPESVVPTAPGSYDIYPGFKVPDHSIQAGYESLAGVFEKHQHVILEGYVGVFWEDLRNGIDAHLQERGLKVKWQKMASAFKPVGEVETIIAPFLGGDDPVFGKKTTLTLIDFYDIGQIEKMIPDPTADINIVYGPGAALCQWEGLVCYVDLPKNELQFRMRAGATTNLGAVECTSPKSMYKRFYFVDWVVLNLHKQQLLPRIDLLVDDQRPEKPFWTTGECLRSSLEAMSVNFFRVRPWFEPGAWGGSWMKNHITQLSREVPNYAWSFELIVPENGLLLVDNGKVLECSFDFLMFQAHENVLGAAADRFGVEFPIRFDFLDTFDGGNLSVQVHPREDFIKEAFGENFTQDECYYMLDTKEDSEVFLGFKGDIDPSLFRVELESSLKNTTEVDIEKYVNKVKVRKHDLFLIPAGTIHSSGKNNLVLEISATPYIFTFKLYDWLRLDLDGQPRPLNLDRGFLNLNFARKGEVIDREHIARPELMEKGEDWVLFHLPTHKDHFYDVHRMEFHSLVEVDTQNQCHVLSLVEGESILLETAGGLTQRFNFAETFVVPAACRKYKMINEGMGICKVIKAFVKA
ncbi:MAG: hypothetical protein KDC85_15995 [Saprospiraceae bacterium]|nr:hypothetical protein [Saprospiraceae bacterium]